MIQWLFSPSHISILFEQGGWVILFEQGGWITHLGKRMVLPVQRFQLLLPAQFLAEALHPLVAITLNHHVSEAAGQVAKTKGTNRLIIDQHAGHILPNLVDEGRKRLDGQGRAEDEEHIAGNHICSVHPSVLEWERFSVKYNVWLHQMTTLAVRNPFYASPYGLAATLLDVTLQLRNGILLTTFNAGCCRKTAVRLDKEGVAKPCRFLQTVNVLRIDSQQYTLLLQQFQEVVGIRGFVLPRKDGLFSELVSAARTLMKR